MLKHTLQILVGANPMRALLAINMLARSLSILEAIYIHTGASNFARTKHKLE